MLQAAGRVKPVDVKGGRHVPQACHVRCVVPHMHFTVFIICLLQYHEVCMWYHLDMEVVEPHSRDGAAHGKAA